MASKQVKLRILLKLSQFICSAFVVYCLYNTGPHWILTLACLLVPPFGTYLLLRSPDQKSQRTPSQKYHGVLKSKSWLRVEIAICLTMGVVLVGFGILLLYGFLKLADNVYFLLAGLGSIVAALLYIINGLVAVGLLRQSTVNIATSEKVPKQMSCTEGDDPNHFSIPAINGQQNAMQQEKLMAQVEERKGRPVLPLANTSFQTNDEKILASSQDINYHFLPPITCETQQVNQMFASESSGSRSTLPVDQQLEMNQHIIDYIREELDRSLDNEVNNYGNSGSYTNNNSKNSDNYDSNNNDNNNNNSNNSDDVNGTVAVKSKTWYRYAPTRVGSTSNPSQCSQMLQLPNANFLRQNSKRKVTPIPLMVTAGAMATGVRAQRLDDNRRIEHFNAQFEATGTNQTCGTFGRRYSDEMVNGCMNSEVYDQDIHPTEPRHRRHQRFAFKADEQGGMVARRTYSRDEQFGSRHSRCDRSSDDDSTSGSCMGPMSYYENSMALKLENHSRDTRPGPLAIDVPTQDIHDSPQDVDRTIISEIDPSSSIGIQQVHSTTPRTYGRRGSGSKSQQRYRRGSADIRYPSYTYTESDDEGSPSPTGYSSAFRSRHKTSFSSRDRGSMDPSCMTSIVTAIDSGRESEIIRNNSPRRTSSRNKKMRNKGFEVMIRAQSDDERFRTRRQTRSVSSSSHEKPNDAYFVTEF